MNGVDEMYISDSIKYIGVDDTDIDLFEGQYVVPNGVSYNSYVIKDEKTAVMDTADKRKTDSWLANLERELDGGKPDYLVISHLEPDHAGSIEAFLEKYPDTDLVVNAKSLAMLAQFFEREFKNVFVVKEGDELNLGKHTLVFIMAPMVHWPEVMVEYEKSEKVLFSADGFGKFGALSCDEDWTCEARRYYINIVGRYGSSVQALLKKASALDIAKICPLHGPILDHDLDYYIGKYNIWSSYEPEDDGVLVAYASMHGNTAAAAEKCAALLEEHGAKKVVLCDLARCDMAEAVEDAFRYDKLVVASATYDTSVPAVMERFLSTLKKKAYQKRKAAIIENGSWAPMAAKHIKAYFDEMKNVTVCEKVVTIKSVMKKAQEDDMDEMVKELLEK